MPFDVIHDKLGRSNQPFDKKAKDSINSAAMKGLNEYIEEKTGGAIKEFLKRRDNTLFINPIYLPQDKHTC